MEQAFSIAALWLWLALIADAILMPRHLLTPSVEAVLMAEAAAVTQRRRTAPAEPVEEG